MSDATHIETSKEAHEVVKREVDKRNNERRPGEPRHTFESVSHDIITKWSTLLRDGK